MKSLDLYAGHKELGQNRTDSDSRCMIDILINIINYLFCFVKKKGGDVVNE